jgi:type I restriction enzyme R subunit
VNFKPFNPDGETRKFRNHLPHWRQEKVTYFVTTRLADSIPHGTLHVWQQERETWLRVHGCAVPANVEMLPESTRAEFHRRFTAKFHEFLDAGEGACLLRDSENARIVGDALRFFDGERYGLGDFVVMPNHLHVLVAPAAGHELSVILQSWKRFTAREINRRIACTGSLWQSESFNHIVRSEEQFARFRRYIAENPVKARLREGHFLHWRAE